MIKKIMIFCLCLLALLIGALSLNPIPNFDHDSPRNLPWQLPDYNKAKTTVKILNNGQIKLTIEHLPLINIEPEMVAWFYQHLPISTVEISGKRYPWYHIFHPSEHGQISVIQTATNGKPGMEVGALVERQEWFGRYNSKGAGRIITFSPQGMTIKPEKFGLHLGKITHSFNKANFTEVNSGKTLFGTQNPVSGTQYTVSGTQYKVESIIGSDTPIIGPIINAYIRAKIFPEEMIEQWLRHQIEEVSSLQFFLAELYRSERVNNHYLLQLNPKTRIPLFRDSIEGFGQDKAGAI